MAWRLARSLETLRAQINTAYPNRSKTSDGTIGDTAHASRASDHNPNSAGVVTALDLTHDPANGFDSWKFAEQLRLTKDPRVKYVISNGRIYSSVVSPWQWRTYTGANKHAHHVHVSVMGDANLYDLASEWKFEGPVSTPRPPETRPAGITADMRKRMAKKIIQFEGRFKDGKLAVYHPPANDGGGAFEVAGINVKFHPTMAARLKLLIETGRADQAENEAAGYLIDYTKAAAGWTEHAGPEFYLRDSIFNRGPKGAARILQRAVMVEDDGEVGPKTRAAMARYTPDDLLLKLRWAREDYEKNVVGYRANFWKGLQNRWDKALVAARDFQKEQGKVPVAIPIAVGVGVFAALFGWIEAHPVLAALIAVFVAAGIIAAIEFFKRSRNV